MFESVRLLTMYCHFLLLYSAGMGFGNWLYFAVHPRDGCCGQKFIFFLLFFCWI